MARLMATRMNDDSRYMEHCRHLLHNKINSTFLQIQIKYPLPSWVDQGSSVDHVALPTLVSPNVLGVAWGAEPHPPAVASKLPALAGSCLG
jgi:hypothetical protein